MRLTAEKRAFLSRFLDPEDVKAIEESDEPPPYGAYKKQDGWADGLVDLMVGFKGPTTDDPIIPYLNDVQGRRPALTEAQKEAIRELERDPSGRYLVDFARSRVVPQGG